MFRGLSELFRTEDVRLHERYHVNALATRQSHNISMPRESVSAEAETPTPQLFGLKRHAFGSFLASNNAGVFTKLGKVFRISGM